MASATVEFSHDQDRELLAEIPALPAVFALYGHAEGEPYVSRTTNLRRRLQRLLGGADWPQAATRRLNLRERVARIEYWLVGSDFESQFVLYRVLRRHFPERYRDRMRLRPAPLVKFDLANPYPRAFVTTRLGRLGGPSVYYGPFASRVSAEKFLNDSLDLFRIRRCPDDLNPNPAFPGCIYSEMKMCLAPCFRGCTEEQYGEEVRRVQRYLDTSGDSLQRELEAEREAASVNLEFETAAAVHAKLAKAHDAAGQRPELARRIDQLNGLMVQRSATEGAVKLFRIDGGAIGEPFDYMVSTNSAELLAGGARRQPVSMEARIGEALEHSPPTPKLSTAELGDHLALLRRWFFRSSRTGELFLTESRNDQPAELPWRRIVRGVSRIYSAAQASPDPAP